MRVLIATDIAARGIDVDGISHVINFDFPPQPEDYVHRIGRTGRTQAIGDAISFVTHDDADSLRRLERFLGRGITRKKLEGFVANAPAAPFAVARRRAGACFGGQVPAAPGRRPKVGSWRPRKAPGQSRFGQLSSTRPPRPDEWTPSDAMPRLLMIFPKRQT